ncbi:MAG: NifU N-terminal domain-containing protein [Phycisphaerales bacterium]|nr:NifU N-terminal domain-containing protein [Phycisphaerales bacterium]
MPFKVVSFESTPNPHALRCVLDAPLPALPIQSASPEGPGVPEGGARSYRDAGQARGDAAAEAMFSVPGVVGVMIREGWLTISKAPTAKWSAVRSGVEKALAAL